VISLTLNPKKAIKSRFKHQVDTPELRRQAERYLYWLDVGFLRVRWKNQWQIAPGVYRSNNPSPERFDDLAALGLKTVVNLRGDVDVSPSKLVKWECAQRGITYVSHPLSHGRAPSREQLMALVNDMPTWAKPVLIHCKSGADRTGLVSAIWRLTQENEPLEAAREELSAKFLHIKEGKTGVLDEVLTQFGACGSTKDFAQWVAEDYDAAAAEQSFHEAQAKIGTWDRLRATAKATYKQAQMLEAQWHKSFEAESYTGKDLDRARFFCKWIDHGVLRGIWTNEDEVFPGVIRSNHPTEARFRKYAEEGLRTVVNLRAEVTQPPHVFEKQLCDELGLTLLDVPIAGGRAPTRDEVSAVLAAIEGAEKPVLFHCKSGADRTGIVAALLVLSRGGTVAEARKQLSWKYLHTGKGRKSILDGVIDAYEQSQARSATSFDVWLHDHYDPEQVKRRS